MTQADQIAAHLRNPGARLTALDALRMYGISRTAARVLELRKSGMDIRSNLIPVVGRNGVAHVTEYSLGPEVRP